MSNADVCYHNNCYFTLSLMIRVSFTCTEINPTVTVRAFKLKLDFCFLFFLLIIFIALGNFLNLHTEDRIAINLNKMTNPQI